MVKNCCIASAGCSSFCYVWVTLRGQAAAQSTVVPLDLHSSCVLPPHCHVTSRPLRGVYNQLRPGWNRDPAQRLVRRGAGLRTRADASQVRRSACVHRVLLRGTQTRSRTFLGKVG
ncbi:hypothetical protein Y032_0473g2096 [Ancylostoma ceylanicum]|uniref:Uncharacterized protein n=1 Tax=Ancylostoma ceylanicum TaxID=53326 RepID=A0A016WW99_9BILA|nr:hypothetical protein Y032_0473g2096 [Ancylostoma ceylanicum]